MAKVIGMGQAKSNKQNIHDPTCGSGSLLLKAHDEAQHATGFDLAIYGQEMDNATKALARMNMILHDCLTAEIEQDNTLSTPHFKDAKTGGLMTFDFVVANPPFSSKAVERGQHRCGSLQAFRPGQGQRLEREEPHPRGSTAEERRLRLPAAHPGLPQEHRQRRGDSAPRRALSRQRRGRHPARGRPPRLHQGHHRPARQPVLRHRHSRLHPGAGQGRRRWSARASS
jgi:hypothetical protein